MTPSLDRLIETVIAGGHDSGPAFDRLVDAGSAAVAPLVAALDQGSAVPILTAMLASLRLDDPVAVLQPALTSPVRVTRAAAITALGSSGDPRALPVLEDALHAHRFTAMAAIGRLGVPAGLEVLDRFVERNRPSASVAALMAEDALKPLRGLAAAAAAQAELGEHRLAPLVIEIATTVPGDGAGSPARLRAVAALQRLVAPGVAAALRQATRDPDREVAVEAVRGLRCIGRGAEVEALLEVVEVGGVVGNAALDALTEWAGVDPGDGKRPVDRTTLDAWWSRARAGIDPALCYRRGALASPGILIEALARGAPGELREDLALVSGCREVVVELGMMPATPGEIARLRAWWTAHAAELPAGQLHRWGRSVSPSALD